MYTGRCPISFVLFQRYGYIIKISVFIPIALEGRKLLTIKLLHLMFGRIPCWTYFITNPGLHPGLIMSIFRSLENLIFFTSKELNPHYSSQLKNVNIMHLVINDLFTHYALIVTPIFGYCSLLSGP